MKFSKYFLAAMMALGFANVAFADEVADNETEEVSSAEQQQKQAEEETAESTESSEEAE